MVTTQVEVKLADHESRIITLEHAGTSDHAERMDWQRDMTNRLIEMGGQLNRLEGRLIRPDQRQ